MIGMAGISAILTLFLAGVVSAAPSRGAPNLDSFHSPLSSDLAITPALGEDALARVMARSPALASSWAGIGVDRRHALLAEALSAQATALARRLEAAVAAPGTAEAALAFHESAREALDALLVLETQSIPEKDSQWLREIFTAMRAEAESRFARESAALVAANMDRISSEAIQMGRTRFLKLEGGAVLAVKDQHHHAHERAMMSRAELFGLPAPVALPADQGTEPILRYLLAPELARGYISYLGDRLSLPRSERQAQIRQSALVAIDQMAILQHHGHRHASLIALSHSNAAWGAARPLLYKLMRRRQARRATRTWLGV